MFPEDVQYLCCPISHKPLEISQVFETNVDGEILSGELYYPVSGNKYPIKNGIPRFVFDKEYNKTWDYKWTQIDRGKGLNYRVVDKSDPMYRDHIFDLNNYNGQAYRHARDKVVLDIGCGVGQNSWLLLEEQQPFKVIAMDLTGGVNIFRKIMLERFPQYKSKILMVQASVFSMPFKDETFDYVFSLGVLHHTGNTRQAIKQACRVLKYGGQINLWIYASEPVPYEAEEPNRPNIYKPFMYVILAIRYLMVSFWIHTFRKMPHDRVVSFIEFVSSDFWYSLHKIPLIKTFVQLIFPSAIYEDYDMRFINNYDGYVNAWSDTWNEHEIFPVLRESNIAIQGIADWRLGFWGIKIRDFYL